MGWLFTVLAVLVAGSWYGYRKRLAEHRRRGLTDDAVRRIEAHGRVEMDEPLDLEEAAEEEEKFWSESWDEPEPL